MRKTWFVENLLMPLVVGVATGLFIHFFVNNVTIPIYKKLFIEHSISGNGTIASPFILEQPRQQLYRKARHHYGNAVDTLGSRDTVYFYPPKKYQSGEFEMLVVADSLSGSTNGELTVEYSDLGLIWDSMEDEKINGNKSHLDFRWNYRHIKPKIRVVCTSTTSTQLTRVQFQMVTK